MKILVIGGTGAFGARLCDLLARDGHDVTIASRRKPTLAKRPVWRLGSARSAQLDIDLSAFAHREFDRNGALTGFGEFNVIVDAAGPFHAYGDDPYRVANAAIEADAHYFDLCDNADFCQGISVLDDKAQRAGVAVYSGMSSVPAISSSAVAALAEGAPIDAIETAILPGNKAPRGRAVVASIVHQTGIDYNTIEGGTRVGVRAWSNPKTYDLGQGIRRQGWRIEVPDQRLFPHHFKCPNVTFRAGLELALMRYGLGVFSFVRSKLGFSIGSWFITLVMIAANALHRFGTDVGGMVVDVVCRENEGIARKRWVLLAKSGDGPYVPTIAVRVACRDMSIIPAGAGPALSLLPLDKIEAGLSDLDITTNKTSTALNPLFSDVLGEEFKHLPTAVRATHNSISTRRFIGRASVARGTGLQAQIAALLFGFPPSNQDVEVEVVKRATDEGETWFRRFGSRKFKSHLRKSTHGISERFGPFEFGLDLKVIDGALHFPVKSGRCLGIPIPSILLPKSIATESERDGRFQFDVHLKAPTGATLVHYKGWLEPVSD